MEKWFPAGLVLAGLVVAFVAFPLFQHMQADERTAAAAPPAAEDAVAAPGAVRETLAVPVLRELSPETRVAMERFRCICGCPDTLSKCTCTKIPGSVTMKNFLQGLVDRGLSNEAIDRAMVEKYGREVLLFLPPEATGRGD